MSAAPAAEAPSAYAFWPAYALCFLMIAFPAVLELLYVKAALFGLLLAITIVIVLKTGRWGIDSSVACWTVFLSVVSAFFTLRGLLFETPGALKSGQVYVLWPLVYVALFAGIRQTRFFVAFEKIATAATLFIAAFGLVVFLGKLRIIPQLPIATDLALGEELSVGLYEGYVQLMFPGLNSMPFLAPFLIAWLMTASRDRQATRWWVWSALVLGLVLALISGRRALLVITALAPLLTLVFRRFQPAKERELNRKYVRNFIIVFVLACAASLAVLNVVYQVKLSAMWDMVAGGFRFSATTEDIGASVRREQFYALLDGWREHPLLGAGFGASAYGSIRSDTVPWSYELYYIALLFHAGLLGLGAYTAGILWTIQRARRVIAAGGLLGQLMIPSIVGMVCYLIATATNPYLVRFDGLWVIFLPLAIINYRWVHCGKPIVDARRAVAS